MYGLPFATADRSPVSAVAELMCSLCVKPASHGTTCTQIPPATAPGFSFRSDIRADAGEPVSLSMSAQNKLHLEKHFTIPDIAKLWGMSEKSVRGLFLDHPDVLKIGGESRYEGRTPVRGYLTLYVPESVMISVHQSLRSRRSRARKQAA
jgi:hypothetical protein